MNEVFIKKFWNEENILFYLHFQNNKTVRQIEVTDQGIKRFDENNLWDGESGLNDALYEDMKVNFKPEDYITKEEFELVWNKQN